MDLGEGYRINSSRQSNPNINNDFIAASATDTTNNRNSRNFKSAPTSRATTPTRLRSRNRDMMQFGGDSNGFTNGQSRPLTATSIYSQESGYPDENASSTWDSRSIGRDSALGPYMASSNYARGNGFHAADTPDRPNPFHQGSNLASEADNVVQMFLMNMNSSLSSRPPGRIEDLPSPTSTIPTAAVLASPTDESDHEAAASHRTVLSQMRRNFFNKSETDNGTTEPKQKTNKYLRPENRWSRPDPAATAPPTSETSSTAAVVQGFVAPQMHHAEVVHVRQDSTSTEASSVTETPALNEREVPILADRKFEDPAFINFKAELEREDYDSSSDATAPPPTKKKGFLASIFKKTTSSSKKQQSVQSQSEQFEANTASVDNFEDNHEVHNEIETDFGETDIDAPNLLPRRRSMSKPTDLDEIMRMQEAMEKEQSVHEVFANDPFFQSTLAEYNIDLPSSAPPPPEIPCRAPVDHTINTPMTDEHIYENHQQNHIVPSMDTTQEIDIDAILGYADEKAIENIEWPSQELLPPQQEPLATAHVEIDYNVTNTSSKQQKSKRGGLFSFVKKSKKKPGKNDEVSYYIEEPQPEPPFEEEVLDAPDQQEQEATEEVPTPHEISTSSNSSTKPSFFKFKTKKDKKSPQQFPPSSEVLEENVTIGASETDPSTLVTSTTVKSSSFFRFKEKPVTAKAGQDHENIVTKAVDDKDAFVPPDVLPSDHEIAEQSPATKDDEAITDSNDPLEIAPAAEIVNVDDNDDAKEVVSAQNDDNAPDENDETMLGPIREEKPSFVTQQSSRTDSSNDQLLKSTSATASGPAKKSKKFGGFSSLFKSSNNNTKGNQKQIGTMAPVDISHLLDEEEPENVETLEESKAPDTAPEDDRPRSQASSGTLPRQDRSRQRQKSSSGFANFFGPAKPRPSSQTRLNQIGGRNDKRSRSLPRQKSAPPSQLVSNNAQQPSTVQDEPRPSDSAAIGDENRSIPSPSMREQKRPPPKSKSLGGLFSMQPRRPRGPPPSPPPPQQQPQERNEPTRVSSTSLASRRGRDSKGLTNFLGTSPLRKSNRMPRSATFPIPPAQTTAVVDQEPEAPAQNDIKDNSVDKIELAPDQSAESNAGIGNESTVSSDSRRVMGRRSGRFRKQPNQATPSQLQGPHRQPPPGPGAGAAAGGASNTSAANLTRDIFAETVNRPSRRGSMTSLNQPKETTDILPPERDSEYDQAVSKGMGTGPPNATNRNDSYKRAKGGSGNMRNYNSLPRLGKERQQRGNAHAPSNAAPLSQGPRNDPETRSLGDQRLANRQHRRGGQRGNDNCQMM